MNKIYKLVWSKTRNMYVAVSELAKAHTKSSASGSIRRTVIAGVLACVLLRMGIIKVRMPVR